MDLVTGLIDWKRRRRSEPRARYPAVIHVETRAELPIELSRRVIYTIGSPAKPKRALFICPCGHDHHIDLPIATDPHEIGTWHLSPETRGPTFSPSIDIVDRGRRCHFWLRRGTIQWAYD